MIITKSIIRKIEEVHPQNKKLEEVKKQIEKRFADKYAKKVEVN